MYLQTIKLESGKGYLRQKHKLALMTILDTLFNLTGLDYLTLSAMVSEIYIIFSYFTILNSWSFKLTNTDYSLRHYFASKLEKIS